MKLNTICTVLALYLHHIFVNILCRLSFPSGIVNWNNRTKRTSKWSANTRMIGQGFVAEIGFAQIAFYGIKSIQIIVG